VKSGVMYTKASEYNRQEFFAGEILGARERM